MQSSLSPLISPEELITRVQSSFPVLVHAGSGKAARDKYDEQHLDGALYVDMDTQLANVGPDASKGGRHPLPTPAQFGETLSSLGIDPATHVVIYDDKNGANAAARLWWMLRSIGHAHVQVLDGGLDAALKAGLATNSDKVIAKKVTSYPAKEWQLPTATMEEVDAARKNKGYIVIDVRDTERYDGIKEPIDTIAGHIPGAVNIPFATNLQKDGSFLSVDELKEKYEAAFGSLQPQNVIVHCGSGVTACHTLLAIAAAGMEIPKLYVGSWSEWSRNDKPIGKK